MNIKCENCFNIERFKNRKCASCENYYINRTMNRKNKKEKTGNALYTKLPSVCKIIKKHHEDMKDDSERFSTDYIQNMLGVECTFSSSIKKEIRKHE